MHQGSLSFVRLVSTLWFLAANIFPAIFLERRIICTVSRVHVNRPGCLAKRFIARNKLFPVIVSYYKTLVPLFFPPYWERRSNVRLFIYVSTDFICFLPLFSFFNPVYMKSCIYNFFDIRLSHFTKFVLNQKYSCHSWWGILFQGELKIYGIKIFSKKE